MYDIHRIAADWSRTWSQADAQAFVDLFADDCLYRDDQAGPTGRVCHGKAELKAFHEHFVNALSDFDFRITRAFAAEGSACMEWSFAATHSGVFHGRPPTGIRLTAVGVTVLTLTPEGKIRTCTDYYDGAKVARQFAAASGA